MINPFLSTQSPLARKLAGWIGLFFVLATILLLAWTFWWQQRQSLNSFRLLAANNAAFIVDLGYPQSPQLASQLSRILGMGVGFLEGDGPVENIDASMHAEILELAGEGRASARRIDGLDIALAPLPDSEKFLILAREPPAPENIFSGPFFLPVLILAAACVALVFALSRNLVTPLRDLTSWLPNLHRVTSEKDDSPQDSTIEPLLWRTDEIGTLAMTMVETREHLSHEKELRQRSEKLAALGRVATSLAHEVKNPAAAIRMHADLLSQPAADEKSQSLELIKEEVDHIVGLVDQWMYLAKSSPAKTRSHDLNRITKGIVERIEPQADHAGVVVSKEYSPTSLPVEVDDRRVGQVVRNLLINAIQAMPEGGTLCIQTKRQNKSEAVLIVSDGGPGFSSEALERYGEPFFSEKEGGMGIGLTLSKEVIEALGGVLQARNLPDQKGAEVSVTLPLIR